MTHSPQQFLAALDDRARRVYRQMVKAGYNGMEARQAAADDFRIRSKYNGKRAGAQASRQLVGIDGPRGADAAALAPARQVVADPPADPAGHAVHDPLLHWA